MCGPKDGAVAIELLACVIRFLQANRSAMFLHMGG